MALLNSWIGVSTERNTIRVSIKRTAPALAKHGLLLPLAHQCQH